MRPIGVPGRFAITHDSGTADEDTPRAALAGALAALGPLDVA